LITGMASVAVISIFGASTPLASGRFMFFTLVAIVAAILAVLPLIKGQKRIGVAATLVCIFALFGSLSALPDLEKEAARHMKATEKRQ
jgi:hypothetical protein